MRSQISIPSRNEMSRSAFDLKVLAERQAARLWDSSLAGDWNRLAGRAQQLANDCCETQHRRIVLRRRLRELKAEIEAKLEAAANAIRASRQIPLAA